MMFSRRWILYILFLFLVGMVIVALATDAKSREADKDLVNTIIPPPQGWYPEVKTLDQAIKRLEKENEKKLDQIKRLEDLNKRLEDLHKRLEEADKKLNTVK